MLLKHIFIQQEETHKKKIGKIKKKFFKDTGVAKEILLNGHALREMLT